jgi:hypothetical protein
LGWPSWRSDHPQSLRQLARMLGDEHDLGWADLLYSVRSGEGAFRHRYGLSAFEWYSGEDDGACRLILGHIRAALVEQAGLRLNRIVPTAAPVSVVGAVAG